MDIIRLYQDFGIRHLTEGHKHCREGWVNTSCPFCTGNEGYHLGAVLDGSLFFCWRCGWHPTKSALSKLLNIPETQLKEIIGQYQSIVFTKEIKRKIQIKAFKHPTFTGPLLSYHKKYLEKRQFDPDYLEEIWGLLGTRNMSTLDNINYGKRILAPILWEGKEVSFQTRDVTDNHPLRYMACPQNREIIQHKHILYGRFSTSQKRGICVEGITDVWRFRENTFCTFGIKFTRKQMRLIRSLFDEVYIVYDDDPQAQIQADVLKGDLANINVKSEIIRIPNDPGSMSQDDATHFVKDLLRKSVRINTYT